MNGVREHDYKSFVTPYLNLDLLLYQFSFCFARNIATLEIDKIKTLEVGEKHEQLLCFVICHTIINRVKSFDVFCLWNISTIFRVIIFRQPSAAEKLKSRLTKKHVLVAVVVLAITVLVVTCVLVTNRIYTDSNLDIIKVSENTVYFRLRSYFTNRLRVICELLESSVRIEQNVTLSFRAHKVADKSFREHCT